MYSTGELQLVTLLPVNEHGYVDGNPEEVRCAMFLDDNFIAVADIDAVQNETKINLGEFYNSETGEVLVIDEILTLYCHEDKVAVIPYTRDENGLVIECEHYYTEKYAEAYEKLVIRGFNEHMLRYKS